MGYMCLMGHIDGRHIIHNMPITAHPLSLDDFGGYQCPNAVPLDCIDTIPLY